MKYTHNAYNASRVKSRIYLPPVHAPFSTFCTFKLSYRMTEYREVHLKPSHWGTFPATTMPSLTVWGTG